MTRRRYSLEPLALASGIPLPKLGRRLGMSGSTWQDARDRGVGEKAADRYAVRLGLHAANVWPELIDHALEDALALKRKRQAKWVREKYRRDAAFREAKVEAMRRYWQDCGPALTAQTRRWRELNRGAVNAANRAYHQANRDRLNAIRRANYRAKREQQTAQAAA